MSFDAKRKREAYNAKRARRRKVRRQQRPAGAARGDEYGIRSRSGRRTKLDKPTYESICKILAEGQTLDVAATLSGIQNNTLWDWISQGQKDPEGPFGQFARDVAYAKEVSHRFLVSKIAYDEDWKAAAFLLKNRYPKLYRDHLVQQLEGPDGQALPMSLQTFSVVLELHPDERPKDEQQREPEFRIDNSAATDSAVRVTPSPRSGSNGAS